MYSKFFAYAFVGVFGTTAHFIVLWVCYEHLGIPLLLSTTFGFIVGAFVNYFLNYFFVFKSDQKHKLALTRFLSIAGLGLLLNYFSMYFLQTMTDHVYWINQFVTTVAVLAVGFFLNRGWTFAVDE